MNPKNSEPAQVSSAQPDTDGKARRPYQAPAIDLSASIEPVTLGTKPRNLAGHGC